MGEVVAQYPPGTPIFQGAQSMGGLMTLHAVLRHQNCVRGVVLCSALVNVMYTPILRRAERLCRTDFVGPHCCVHVWLRQYKDGYVKYTLQSIYKSHNQCLLRCLATRTSSKCPVHRCSYHSQQVL